MGNCHVQIPRGRGKPNSPDWYFLPRNVSTCPHLGIQPPESGCALAEGALHAKAGGSGPWGDGQPNQDQRFGSLLLRRCEYPLAQPCPGAQASGWIIHPMALGTARLRVKLWLCHSLAVWLWPSPSVSSAIKWVTRVLT